MLVEVLTSREIAAEQRATFGQQREAQEARVSLEQQRGLADMQAQLAQANVSIDIERSRAEANRARADGEASVITVTGAAEAASGPEHRQRQRIGRGGPRVGVGRRLRCPTAGDRIEQTAMVAALREVVAGGVENRPRHPGQ